MVFQHSESSRLEQFKFVNLRNVRANVRQGFLPGGVLKR
jgi:hypothetical protein